MYKINVMEEVTCPDENCTEVIDTRGVIFRRLPQVYHERFERNARWMMTVKNPNLRLCPTENCEGVLDTSQPRLQCPKCRVRFCR